MTTVKVMADYECWPLWRGENLDPDSLPLSHYLREQLAAWAERYDETLLDEYPPGSGFSSESEAEKFVEDGRELAQILARELGNEYAVTYFNELSQELETIQEAA
jgi:hypothetical protein